MFFYNISFNSYRNMSQLNIMVHQCSFTCHICHRKTCSYSAIKVHFPKGWRDHYRVNTRRPKGPNAPPDPLNGPFALVVASNASQVACPVIFTALHHVLPLCLLLKINKQLVALGDLMQTSQRVTIPVVASISKLSTCQSCCCKFLRWRSLSQCWLWW
jgi:hypothetical protein